jgi:hypothetical protein
MFLKFTFWLRRVLQAWNFVANRRAERAAERAQLLEAVREVCSVVRSSNALAEAQTKLFAQWFESLSTDPSPGRSINYSQEELLDEFAEANSTTSDKLKIFY